MFRNIKIGIRITLSFFLIAFSSILVIGYISYSRSKRSLEEESFNRLTAVREMKASQIEDYFQNIYDQVVTFSQDHTVVNAMKSFKENFDDLKKIPLNDSVKAEVRAYYENEFLPRINRNLEKPGSLEDYYPVSDGSLLLQYHYIANNPKKVGEKHHLDDAGNGFSYSHTHKTYHPYFRNFLEKFGYYDIFLVDAESGDIVYSVFKEVDFGTSLLKGPYMNDNISKVFREALKTQSSEQSFVVDYLPYHPSYYSPAAFIASPIFDGPKKVGVLIFQLPIDRINNIMTNRHEWNKVGLGKSGETYIVGEDFTLRNQSRFLIEDSTNYFKMITDLQTPAATIKKIRNFNSTIGLQEVKTKGTQKALSGKTDQEIFEDYRGVEVLSAYKPLNIRGLKWVIMSEIDEEEAFSHVYSLRRLMIIVFAGLFITIILVSLIISRRITSPLKELTSNARQLAKGNLDTPIHVKGKDEIGILSLSFRKMQVSIKNLIEELKDINLNLEKKVEERTEEIQRQKEMVEEKNKEIVDSINYAKRLQTAILPSNATVKKYFPDSFVLFKPKDIVSGDFYWFEEKNGNYLFASVDCTGHGVPGAMVSVVGANSLNRCVNEFDLSETHLILDKLRELVIETFATSEHEVKDGMDISICRWDPKNRQIQFSGAHNPLWVLKSATGEIEEIKADKQPIGLFDHGKPFSVHHLSLEEGDIVYIFSDGFPDQFGGDRGKKFKTGKMKDLFVSIRNLSMEDQKDRILDAFESWKGQLEQIDDVCVIGIRF